MRLTYAFEGREVELPLRLLVLGPLGSGGARRSEGRPTPVRAANIDTLLDELRPNVAVTVDDCLIGEGGSREVDVEIGSLRDFEPDRLVERIPVLAAASGLLARLQGEAGERADVGEDEERLMAELGLSGGGCEDAARDYAVADLGERLGRQVDAILHAPVFQRVESMWRGLALIMEQLPDSAHCSVDVVDIEREELLEDAHAATAIDKSLLFETVYAQEFGQYGGEPYGAVIGGFEFGRGADDRDLLEHIADVCAHAHAPFIAGASPQLVGLRDFGELTDTATLSELRSAPGWTKWWAFTEKPKSRYVALTVPRVLLRAPYGPSEEGRRPVRGLNWTYREEIARERVHRLWGVAAFGLAGCLFKSFARYRVCVDIAGAEGGQIEGLPDIDERVATGRSQPVEVMLSEQKEAELSELGLMPVTVARAQNFVGFNAANSLHWAVAQVGDRWLDAAMLGDKLSAQLPYLFLACRIAHYLKVIQRDMVGATRSAAQMQSELESWLRRYVSDVDQPAPELRARRPLRQAQLQVTADAGDASKFYMHLELVPHAKLINRDVSVGVEGVLGRL